MRRVVEYLSRALGAVGFGRRDRELQEELRLHAELAREQGRPVPGAAYAMDALRDQRGLPWVETLARDLRFGFRALRRAPAFTAAAVPTLALAIGASTVMFAVLKASLLRPLPYPQADRLALIWTDRSNEGVAASRTAFADVDDWRRRTTAFQAIAFFDPASAILTLDGQAEHVSVAYVSPNLFTLLGAPLIRGRVFTDGESAARQPLAIVSERFRRSRLGASIDPIGSSLSLDGRDLTIVGVAAAGADFPWTDTDLWLPYTAEPDWNAQRQARGPGSWFVIGRLAPGMTVDAARSELAARVEPLDRYLVGSRPRLTLWLLTGAVLAVLLLASANVAGLTLARHAGRAREIGVRAALGASRARIAGALLAESLCLAAVSGALAVGIAAAALRLVRAMAPAAMPSLRDVSLDPRVFAAACLVCVGTAVLAGLAPAIAAVRGTGVPIDGDGGRSVAGGRSARRLRGALVRGEFALAIVLLAAAGLFVRSLWAAEHVSLGFDPDGVLLLQLSTAGSRSDAARVSTYRAVDEAVAAVPGVERAGLIGDFVVVGGRVEEIATDVSPEPTRILLRRDEASAGVFDAVGARLVSGRAFSDLDTTASPRVAIVNETMARELWNGDPIGRRFNVGGSSAPWFTVVGLVADMRREGPEIAPAAQMFEPIAQNPSRLETLIVRAAGDDPLRVAAAVRDVVHRADPAVAVYGVNTLDARFGAFLVQRRLLTSLIAVFSLYAALLAAVGIYGLVHYSVAVRRREIAIRLAIGARPSQIVSLVLREAMALSLTGVIVGTMGALALGRAGASLLFGVRATDPVTFAAAIALLAAAALAASVVPARRATAIDPNAALRQD